MRHIIRGKQIYTLEMYLAGYPFEEFERRAKEQLLCDCLRLSEPGYVRGIEVRFQTLSLSPDELRLETLKYLRVDGQYILQGNFTSRETIIEHLKKHVKIILLEGATTTEVQL
jgi:hypothetical protein